MGRLVVVEGDPVAGTDQHNVTGTLPNGSPYVGVGDFEYVGSMTGDLSDFVRVGGKPLALATSRSALDAGEAASPTGRHSGPMGTNFQPSGPNTAALSIIDPVLGPGVPNAGAGSALLSVHAVNVLLDGDDIDTCSGVGAQAGSTVAAQGQDFATCTE